MKDYMPEAYYDAIAEGYDEAYTGDDAELKGDIAMIRDVLEQNLPGARTLELASGTGYWSRIAARAAKSVLGIERSEKMLEVANAGKARPNLSFAQGDAWKLDRVKGEFDAIIAFFWFSHVPKARINPFLAMLARRVGPGGLVILADSLGGDAYKTPLKAIEGSEEDTYAERDLGEAGKFDVLKNCYEAAEIIARLEESGSCRDVKVQEGTYFWVASYLVPDENDDLASDEDYSVQEIMEA